MRSLPESSPSMAVQFVGRDPSVLLVSEGLGPKRWHSRVATITNEHTVSAGEMVAAFASENGLAKLVGTETASGSVCSRAALRSASCSAPARHLENDIIIELADLFLAESKTHNHRLMIARRDGVSRRIAIIGRRCRCRALTTKVDLLQGCEQFRKLVEAELVTTVGQSLRLAQLISCLMILVDRTSLPSKRSSSNSGQANCPDAIRGKVPSNSSTDISVKGLMSNALFSSWKS